MYEAYFSAMYDRQGVAENIMVQRWDVWPGRASQQKPHKLLLWPSRRCPCC